MLQESITLHDVKALQLVYRRHCEVTAPPRETLSLGVGREGGPGLGGQHSPCPVKPHITRTAKPSDIPGVSPGDPGEVGAATCFL